jgi:hypothetical protein
MTFDWMTVGGSGAIPSDEMRGPDAPCSTPASLTLLEPMSTTRNPL